MTDFDLKALAVSDISLLDDAAEKFQADAKGDFVKESKGISYRQLWQDRYDYEKPGQDKDDTKAVFLFAYYKKGLHVKDRKWTRFVFDFFSNEIGEENILSNIYVWNQEAPFCVCLIFPLQNRKLSRAGFVSGGEIHKKLKSRFIAEARKAFDIKEVELSEEEKAALEEKMKQYPVLNTLSNWTPVIARTEMDDVTQPYNAIRIEQSIQTDLSYEEITKIQKQTVYYFTDGVEKSMFRNAQVGNIEPEAFLVSVDEYLDRHHKSLTKNDRKYVKNKVISAVYGYYVLDCLIEDNEISDIKILGPECIRVKISGHRYMSDLHFENETDYRRFIEGVAIRNRLDLERRPQVIFTDKDTSPDCRMRFDITTEVLNSVPFPYLHIRKIPKQKRTIQDLMDLDMLPRQVAEYLIDAVKNAPGMVFCGKGASGKTTLLSALLEYIPYDKAGVVIQESEELFSETHPELEFQHVLAAEQSPTGNDIGLMDLTKAALVSDEDYIIIGEVKGGECLYAINACATGHQFMCTVHSSSSQSAIDKMSDYIMYASKYSKQDAEYMLKDIKIVVFMKNFKVEEISEVAGWNKDEEHLQYNMIYCRDPESYIRKKRAGVLQ